MEKILTLIFKNSTLISLRFVQQQCGYNITDQLQEAEDLIFILYLLHLYPGFYSYTEGATWKILDLLTETLLI